MQSYFKFIIPVLALAACDSSDEPVKTEPQTRLKSITLNLQDQTGDFKPADKKVFSYSAGKLVKEEYYTFDENGKVYVLFYTSAYEYQNDKLKKITRIEGTRQKVTTYTYNGDVLIKMNLDDEIDTEATIVYEQDTVQVRYLNSNGRFFLYRFSLNNDNIDFERTIEDSQEIGSEITNEFDSGINPYSLLGYTDMFFTNYSKNNKTKSISEYFTHQPQAVPYLYEYEYNADNLPLKQTITYKSYPSGEVKGKGEIIFEYSEE